MIHIMVGAALRVGEAHSLRWQDCRIGVLSDESRLNVLHLKVLGKHSEGGGKRELAYGTPTALAAYYRLHIARTGLKEPKDTPLFQETHRDGFRELLIAAGVREDEHSQTRDMKSLRPTGISRRLDETTNPDYRDIAKWARTSPAQIVAFYDQTHPEASVTRIMGKKSKRTK
jgi:hypothetical protein